MFQLSIQSWKGLLGHSRFNLYLTLKRFLNQKTKKIKRKLKRKDLLETAHEDF